jgi:hypothetical protein
MGADRDEVASITAQQSKLSGGGGGGGLGANRNGAVSPGRILRDVKVGLYELNSVYP